jgi:perosamine synthetase
LSVTTLYKARERDMTQFFPVSRPSLTARETEYVMRAVESGWISSIGEFVDEFEEGFARFVGTKHAISVSNGTVALHLALTALGIGKGHEVIVPDLSFIATANAVLMCGARPVFADIDRENLCLSPSDLESRLTSRTRAIIPVHLYGHPAAMGAISAFATRHNLLVIEDAAEAHGAQIGEDRVGSLGHCGTFSFYGNKLLTTGEGGMITTNEDALAARCRSLRDHAMSKVKRYWHEELGYNYRMTNIQAALGCAQLGRADDLIEGRRVVCNWYRKHLEGVEGIVVRRASNWATPAPWLMCAEIETRGANVRDELMRRLKARGVDTRPYFYPMSDMPYFERADTAVAHDISQRGLNLPTYIGLTQIDIAEICRIVSEEWKVLR